MRILQISRIPQGAGYFGAGREGQQERTAAMPAWREAQRVREMTPLFWEKVVLGIDVHSAAISDDSPSPSNPPCTLSCRSPPCTAAAPS